MQSAPLRWTTEKDEENFPGGHRKTLFLKDGVRGSAVELEPGGSLPKENPGGPTLLVGIGTMKLSNGKTHTDELGPEGLLWADGPLLETNSGKQPARFILLEF